MAHYIEITEEMQIQSMAIFHVKNTNFLLALSSNISLNINLSQTQGGVMPGSFNANNKDSAKKHTTTTIPNKASSDNAAENTFDPTASTSGIKRAANITPISAKKAKLTPSEEGSEDSEDNVDNSPAGATQLAAARQVTAPDIPLPIKPNTPVDQIIPRFAPEKVADLIDTKQFLDIYLLFECIHYPHMARLREQALEKATNPSNQKDKKALIISYQENVMQHMKKKSNHNFALLYFNAIINYLIAAYSPAQPALGTRGFSTKQKKAICTATYKQYKILDYIQLVKVYHTKPETKEARFQKPVSFYTQLSHIIQNLSSFEELQLFLIFCQDFYVYAKIEFKIYIKYCIDCVTTALDNKNELASIKDGLLKILLEPKNNAEADLKATQLELQQQRQKETLLLETQQLIKQVYESTPGLEAAPILAADPSQQTLQQPKQHQLQPARAGQWTERHLQLTQVEQLKQYKSKLTRTEQWAQDQAEQKDEEDTELRLTPEELLRKIITEIPLSLEQVLDKLGPIQDKLVETEGGSPDATSLREDLGAIRSTLSFLKDRLNSIQMRLENEQSSPVPQPVTPYPAAATPQRPTSPGVHANNAGFWVFPSAKAQQLTATEDTLRLSY